MKHEGTIVISGGGKIKATTQNIKGASCKGLLDWMKSLGEVEEHKSTSDMYKKETSRIQKKVENNE